MGFSSTVQVNANTTDVRDYSGTPLYTNLVNASAVGDNTGVPFFGIPGYTDVALAMNSYGYPSATFGMILLRDIREPITSSFKGRHKGTATISTPDGTVSNKVVDALTGYTTFDITLSSGSTQLWIQVSNPVDFRELEVIRPGYNFSSYPLFTNEAVNHFKEFGFIRMMDVQHTNNNKIPATDPWGNRPKPTDVSQASGKGMCWEHQIALANAHGGDIWLCIPHNADTVFIQNAAAMTLANLNSNAFVYVENSNEVWNSQAEMYAQFETNYQRALAEAQNPNSPLRFGGEINEEAWHFRYHALRTKQIGDAFKTAFGTQSGRIRPIYAGQIVRGMTIRSGLEMLAGVYGNPLDSIWGVSGAPYYNLGEGNLSATPAITKAQALTLLQQSVNGMPALFEEFMDAAVYYGFKERITCYEAGPDTFGGNHITTKYDASMDPQMRVIHKSFYDMLHRTGFLFANQFIAGVQNAWNDQFGTWGLAPKWGWLGIAAGQPNAPQKLLAIRDVKAASRPALGEYPLTIPIDARKVVGRSDTWATDHQALVFLNQNDERSYLFRIDTPGLYALHVCASTNMSDRQLEFKVNNGQTKTVNLKNTGDFSKFEYNSTPVFFTLGTGLNSLRFKSLVQQGFDLKFLRLKLVKASTQETGEVSMTASPVGEALIAATDNDGQHTVLGLGSAAKASIDDLFPISANVNWYNGVAVAGSTTFSIAGVADQPGGFVAYQSPAAVSDIVRFDIPLKAGSYRLMLIGQKTTDGGKFNTFLNGSQIGSTTDWYVASNVNNQRVNINFTVTQTGMQRFEFRNVARNPASAGQFVVMSLLNVKPV